MMKISIRPKILDIAIFLLSVIAVVFISISVYATQGNTLYVHISGATGEWIESLDKDQKLQIPGPLGITYVHIENHSVRIEDSPCDNKLCIAMGRSVRQTSGWPACRTRFLSELKAVPERMKSMLQRSEQRTVLQVSHADLTALLGAFCFILSAIEYMLPKPLPFMRLGIANLPILLAVDLLPFPWFLTLAVVKVIGMSVISGTLFSFVALFSLLGTFSAALVMWAARKAGGKWITQIGVSILGAITSNAIQIFVARYVVFGEVAWLIAPLFVLTGLVTGTALGIFAAHFAETSQWYAYASGMHLGGYTPSVPEIGAETPKPAAARQKKQKRRKAGTASPAF